MTPSCPRFQPATPRSIELLAFPDVQLLDVAGPLQVFASANDLATGARPYEPSVVASGGEGVIASAGLGLATMPLSDPAAPIDTLVVAGGRGVNPAAQDLALVHWVRAKAASARRVVSVCSGAFLLAEAGLLDGRRAVTHWSRCAELARRYPAVRVEPDPIFVRDGQVWTSAGITAGVDLALALVEDDLGGTMALAVARQLVVFLKRPGGQAQFSAALALQVADAGFDRLHSFMSENLERDLSVAVLADAVGMSQRSFVRRYRAATGSTPARAVERLRVEAARHLLSETARPAKQIAARCGFGTDETMRRAFLRLLATSPQRYRDAFGRVRSTPATTTAGQHRHELSMPFDSSRNVAIS